MTPSTQRPRLLIVVNVFHPDRGGGGAIFSDLAYGLAERGFDVTVRCAYPYYPEWRDKSGRNGWAIERYDENGVHVERYGLFIPSRPNSLLQRMIYEASFLFSLLRSLPRGGGFDLVMTYCPLVGAVAFAALNKAIFRKPLWLNVQDLSADAAAASGIARGKSIIRSLGAIQHLLFNQADVWSSISPVMIDRLQAIRARKQPILYLPNWLNGSMAGAIAQHPDKTGRAPANPVKLLYAGNIGTKQDLLRFCQALQRSDAPFQFRIHGDGGRADDVKNWVNASGDARFTFGPFLDEPAFATTLHDTDFFVITEKSGSGGSFIPCKMISGLASGSAILAVSDAASPLGKEMAAAQPGPWFSWDELDRVPAQLAQIDPAQFTAWKANALRRAAVYTRDRVIQRFDDAIRAILAAHGDLQQAALTTGLEPDNGQDQ
jgi:colanic acid biosynthesis glycosyl transferase WcaI